MRRFNLTGALAAGQRQDLPTLRTHPTRRLLHRNIQTYKMCHRHRSFLDVRGQGDPDFTIIREGAALIL
jgi:hypothetical protein